MSRAAEKIAKLQEELDRHNRIDELRKELESYGYIVEKKEAKEAREDITNGIFSCVFWIGIMTALPLIGGGFGYSYAATSGSLAGAGIGTGLGLVLMLLVQKAYEAKRRREKCS